MQGWQSAAPRPPFCCGPPSPKPPPLEAPLTGKSEVAAAVERNLQNGTGDPVADARKAAHEGEFGLIISGDARFEGHPTGVFCFTPYGAAPQSLFRVLHGDAIGPEERRKLDYANSYNHTLVNLPNYPDADLCRVPKPGERPDRSM